MTQEDARLEAEAAREAEESAKAESDDEDSPFLERQDSREEKRRKLAAAAEGRHTKKNTLKHLTALPKRQRQ